APHGALDALAGLRVCESVRRYAGRGDAAAAQDDEVHFNAALGVGVARQRLVVAAADLVDVAAHDPANDVLAQEALDDGWLVGHDRHLLSLAIVKADALAVSGAAADTGA